MAKMGAIALTLLAAVLFNILGHCEMSIYPGLRRKPLHQSLQQPFDMSSDFLAQLMGENARRRLQQQFEQQLELINMQMDRQRQRQQQRERYRQRLQELADNEAQAEAEADAEAAAEEDVEANADVDDAYNNNRNRNNYINNNNINRNQYVDSNGLFSYKYPSVEFNADILRQRTPFAVGPADPRFYEPDSNSADSEDEDLDPRALDEYQEFVPAESQNLGSKVAAAAAAAAAAGVGRTADNADAVAASATGGDEKLSVLAPAPAETSKLMDSGTTTFHRIKPQSAAAAAAVAGANVVAAMKPTATDVAAEPANANTRHDISALYNKLQKEGKSAAIINHHDATPLSGEEALVVQRQHLGMDGEMGMYLVALIAGVSAAVTVGLIALGIAWYTLHNRSKAAADVEYPAYGVTGPNKDISPSGDRKLAQSAQMYHYQHQKQQIIAMENRQAVEGSCGMSDVESDDDENEEGDYTVYECPGLAPPMGEMEVKNPLFLDETPVTPSSNTTSSTTNNITQATPQQPATQVTKKPTYRVIVGAAPAPNAKATTSTTESTSSEENKKQKKNKK